MAYYLIARDELDQYTYQLEQEHWNNNRQDWGPLEGATVYTEHDIRSGVHLPTGGYWLRITPEGISRHDYDSRPKA